MPTIVIPVYDGVAMLDVCGPYEMFQWAGFEVEVVAERPGSVAFNTDPVRSNALSVNVDGDLTPADADALWVPGGSPRSLHALMDQSPPRYLEFLAAQAERGRLICSVCEGAVLLAAAGLLDGFTVTTHWAFIPYLIRTFPRVTLADGHPRSVLDRNRLTGGGISAGLDEALTLVELLAGRAVAERAQQTTQYYPSPPVTSEIPVQFNDPMAVT